MTVADALKFWKELIDACPHGCRIHLTGGEPFGNWPGLIELARAASEEGLGPLEKVETNAFWAVDQRIARDRIGALDEAGMEKITISADPYHQEFVPLDRCRLLAEVATEILGPARVQVRWRDWLAEGFDTAALNGAEAESFFAEHAAGGRDRIAGRAADVLAKGLDQKLTSEFADNTCKETLLRSKHVHIDPEGRVMPGTCAGIVLGRAGRDTIGKIWQRLEGDFADRPIVGTLAAQGPTGMLAGAVRAGFQPRLGYAGKCHLCWDLRKWMSARNWHQDELWPSWMYDA